MPEAATRSNADLLEASFERAAEAGGDITPLVFARFFECAPHAAGLFQLDTIDPQARGRMLAEMLTILLDHARGEAYVGPTLATIAADHVAYGVEDRALYADWLQALADVVHGLCGAAWTAETAAAWRQECARFLSALAYRRAPAA